MLWCRSSIENIDKRFLLLLTGTPIQNDMSELYSMMNLVDPERFDCRETFLELYGNPPSQPSTPEQLTALQVSEHTSHCSLRFQCSLAIYSSAQVHDST